MTDAYWTSLLKATSIGALTSNTWVRAGLPVVVLVCFELLMRYLGKNDDQKLEPCDWFLAPPLLSAAIAALPGLIAIRAHENGSIDEVATGALVLVILVLVAAWLTAFDRRTLQGRRNSTGAGPVTLMLTTFLPTITAGICLGLVFAAAAP